MSVQETVAVPAPVRTSDLQPPGSKPKPFPPWRSIQWLLPTQWHPSLAWGGKWVGEAASISPSQHPHANHLLSLLEAPSTASKRVAQDGFLSETNQEM